MRAALVALALLCAHPAAAETYDGSRVVIVDGDTFGFGKERFRILNIDTPETFRPRCERELILGLRAKERVASLLRSGPVTIFREGEDRYGRALVRVLVRGRDIGETLVRERLALPWKEGQRRGRSGCGHAVARRRLITSEATPAPL